MTEEVVGVSITSWNMTEEVVGVSIDIMEHDRGSSRCVYIHHGT